MEFVLLSVGVVVVVVSAMLVFFVSLKVMKESSFEEVLAEKTRRQQEVERELGITTKEVKKEPKKKNKKRGKATGKHSEPEEEEVEEAEVEAEAEEPESGRHDTTEIPRVEKWKKQKPQKQLALEKLPEKVESKKKGKTSQLPSETVPPYGTGTTSTAEKKTVSGKGKAKPKFQAVNILESEEPFTVAESKNRKKKQNTQVEASTPGKPAAKELGLPDASASSKPAAGNVREETGNKAPAKEVQAPTSNALKASDPGNKNLPTVQPPPVELSGTDWNTNATKVDAVVTLTKKQTDGTSEEVKDLRSQLSSAYARYTELYEQHTLLRQQHTALDDKTQAELVEKVKEIDALKLRLSTSHAEHLAEVKQLNQQLFGTKGKGANGANPAEGQAQLIKVLTEDNKKLKEQLATAKTSSTSAAAAAAAAPSPGEDLQLKVKFMDDALKQNAVLLNASENAKKTLDQKLKQTEDRLQKTQAQLKTMETKAQTAEESLKQSEVENKSLSDDLESAKEELAEHLSKLKKEGQQTVELEEKVKAVQSQFLFFEELIKQKDAELESLRRKTTQLAEDLIKTNDAGIKALEELRKRHEEEGPNSEELNSQIQEHKEELKASNSRNADLEAKLRETTKLKDKFESDLVHYRTVLADTEKTLIQIQSSVESEEESWRQRLVAAQDQLHTSQEEAARLQEELDLMRNKCPSSTNRLDQQHEANTTS